MLSYTRKIKYLKYIQDFNNTEVIWYWLHAMLKSQTFQAKTTFKSDINHNGGHTPPNVRVFSSVHFLSYHWTLARGLVLIGRCQAPFLNDKDRCITRILQQTCVTCIRKQSRKLTLITLLKKIVYGHKNAVWMNVRCVCR